MTDKLTIFRSYVEAAKMMGDAERLAFYDGLFDYALDGVEPEFDGMAKMAFLLCKPYMDTSKKLSEAGAKGGSKGASKPDSKGASKGASKPVGGGIEKGASKPASEGGLVTNKKKKKEEEVEVEEEIEGEESFSPKKKDSSLASVSGAAVAGATPQTAEESKTPYCAKCNSVVFFKPKQAGFACMTHGLLKAKEEVVFR